ncbi:MAG: HAMP domain-containing histidine kinase [Spirochaetales bacterium]|nr:HAMP domain-containing histidine kinase [Spirochaetales bacterium]
MEHPENQDSEIETNQSCPITGLPILSKPEWTDVRFGKTYRITFRLLGKSILLLQISGYAALQDIQDALRFTDSVLEEVISRDRGYVLLEDVSNTIGLSREARRYLIEYLKKREGLRCVIYYGISPLLRLSFNLGKRLNIVPFVAEIADNHVDAVGRAQEMLPDAQLNAGKPHADTDRHVRGTHDEDVSPHRVVSHPDWYHQAGNHSIRFEIVNDNILHGISIGRLENEHIDPVFSVKEKIMKSSLTLGVSDSYYYVLGLTEAQGTAQGVRKSYVEAVSAWYEEHPFRMLIFYGANKWLKAGIALARHLVPFRVRVADDLDGALAIIAEDASATVGSSIPPVTEDSTEKSDVNNQVQYHVNDLLQYIEGISWEIDGVPDERERDSSNPFWPVFDAIDLIKWELDDILDKREQAEQELGRAKEAAEAADTARRVKNEFLANVSHELRTPLTHIIGFTQLVADGRFGSVNEAQEEHLRQALESSGHLRDLIDDILDLSEIEAGRMELQISSFRSDALLHEAVQAISDAAATGMVSISVETEDPPEVILGDRPKLDQVMYNLLSNAVKFSPGGTVSVHATSRRGSSDVKASGDDAMLVVTVIDSGTGIQNDDLDRVFLPFERAVSPTNWHMRGTGLGLSVAREIVKLHGGRIWAESDGPEKGSTFVMEIPVRESDSA